MHPELALLPTDEPRVKLLRAVELRPARGGGGEGVALPQTSVDASGLLLSRPNSLEPPLDVMRGKEYTLYMDVPGLTKHDVQLPREPEP